MLTRLLRQLAGPKRPLQSARSDHSAVIRQALNRQAEGEWRAAEHLLRSALSAHDRNCDLVHLLGTNLLTQGDNQQAIDCLEEVVRIEPGRFQAYFHLAQAHQALGKSANAEQNYQRAIELNPRFVEAMTNLAMVQRSMGNVIAAESWLHKAINIDPDFSDAIYNLARLLQEEGRIPEALQYHRRAFTINPSLIDAHSNYVYWLNFDPAYSPEQVFEAHVSWAHGHAESLRPANCAFANDADPHRQLRIGYVSPNFKDHAAASFFVSTLVQHDSASTHVICYSDTHPEDAISERIRNAADGWRDTARLSDIELAELVRSDHIDILVDLSGHTEGNRLLCFARKPAPLQVTWNGYANTTGMSVMDYRITDALADPPGQTEHLHTEHLLRMPDIYMAFEPPANAPEVAPLPVTESGHIVFGSFNAITKLTPQVIATWSRILHAVPDAELLIAAVPSTAAETRILALFAQNNLDAKRIKLHGRLPRADFLKLHRLADLALDPFPFNGTTTTCHSLWMGVPVITLAGNSHVSRVGVSMLSCVGLPELIASSEDEYVKAAATLARNPEKLRALRQGLRQRMAASPLTDARRFAGNLERAYQSIWSEWCHSQGTAH